MTDSPIITSLLNSDLYKFSMAQAVMLTCPDTRVSYRFKNRGKQRFTKEFVEALQYHVNTLFPAISLTEDEANFLKSIRFLKPWFIDALRSYRFDGEEVRIGLTADNDLEITIEGLWAKTIFWEVPLMALISELYFKMVEPEGKTWKWDVQDYKASTRRKFDILQMNGCKFSEFGTRRRRSMEVQRAVMEVAVENGYSNFVGTSNVLLAKEFKCRCVGTMAHEFVMGWSILGGERHANQIMMQKWMEVYGGDLGTAITDTFGTDAFLRDFDAVLARQYDSVRQDSGDPFIFVDKIVKHYESVKIDPLSKTIIFSDSLDAEKCVAIQKYCENRIKCSFGIGTNLTNNFAGSPALNMVIKLYSVDGIPVVKLGDDPGKAMGDSDAVRVAKWINLGIPLEGR